MKDFDDAVITASAAIVVDRRGYIAGWNEGAQTVLGYTAADVVGRACHHVLCGRKPGGELVCHPWCALWSTAQRDTTDDELVLYPRTAGREILRVVLSVFRIGGDDTTRDWLVHQITSAELLSAESRFGSLASFTSPLRRHTRKPKPPETSRH